MWSNKWLCILNVRTLMFLICFMFLFFLFWLCSFIFLKLMFLNEWKEKKKKHGKQIMCASSIIVYTAFIACLIFHFKPFFFFCIHWNLLWNIPSDYVSIFNQSTILTHPSQLTRPIKTLFWMPIFLLLWEMGI